MVNTGMLMPQEAIRRGRLFCRRPARGPVFARSGGEPSRTDRGYRLLPEREQLASVVCALPFGGVGGARGRVSPG